MLKSISIYTFSNFLNAGIGFLLLPIFTYYLTPEDYGKLSLFNSSIQFLVPLIVTIGIGGLAVEFNRLNKGDFKQYSGNSIIVSFVAFLFFLILFFFIGEWLSKAFDISQFWLILIVFACFLKLMPQIALLMYQVKQQAGKYTILNLSLVAMQIILSLILVINYKYGWEGRAWGVILSFGLFTLIAILILRRENLTAIHFNKKFIQQILAFNIPLIPHVLGVKIINLSDKYFISGIVSNEELGLYNVGYQIGLVIFILQQSFVQAYSPFLYSKLAENSSNAKKQIVKVSYLFILGLAAVVVLLNLVSPYFFKYAIDESYAESLKYVVWISVAYLFLGIYKMFVGFILYNKKTILLTYLAIVNILLSLFLNWYLINRVGTMGAAYSTLISMIFMFILTFLVTRKYDNLPWFYFIKERL